MKSLKEPGSSLDYKEMTLCRDVVDLVSLD